MEDQVSTELLPASEVPQPLWTIVQVAERLGVTVRHVRRLVADKRIPFIRWGHLIRFDPVEIEAWIDRGRHGC